MLDHFLVNSGANLSDPTSLLQICLLKILVGKGNLLLLYSLSGTWLSSPLSGEGSKGPLANPLDLDDPQVLRGRDQVLQLLGAGGGIPNQMFPREAEGVLGDGALLSGLFFFWCNTGQKSSCKHDPAHASGRPQRFNTAP